MNVQSEILLAGSIVFVGTWAEGGTLKPTIVFGTLIAAIGTSVVSDMNESLGLVMATIILVGAMLRYVPPLLAKGIGKDISGKKKT